MSHISPCWDELGAEGFPSFLSAPFPVSPMNWGRAGLGSHRDRVTPLPAGSTRDLVSPQRHPEICDLCLRSVI